MKPVSANELRIGNIIKQGKIDLLELRTNDYGNGEESSIVCVRVNGSSVDNPTAEPLSDEWYSRLGFEIFPNWDDKRKDGSVAFLDLGYLFISCGMMGASATLFDNSGLSTGVHFDFVHEIQNCYFSLKGTEIPINPTQPK